MSKQEILTSAEFRGRYGSKAASKPTKPIATTKGAKGGTKSPLPTKKEVIGASKSGLYTFDVVPMGKPSFQKSDRWRVAGHENARLRQRPNVGRWIEFKKELAEQARRQGFVMPPSGATIRLKIPMPVSWSEKKKDRMNNMGHQQKPDTDNICKAIFDSLCDEDSYIYQYSVGKYWGRKGGIIIVV